MPTIALPLDVRSLVFGLVAVVCGVLTGLAITRGTAPIRIVLLGAMTAYVLGIALPPIRRRVPHYRRLAAIPLGLLGAIAYVLGAPTDLPILFVVLGLGGLVDLVWDPIGTVHGSE